MSEFKIEHRSLQVEHAMVFSDPVVVVNDGDQRLVVLKIDSSKHISLRLDVSWTAISNTRHLLTFAHNVAGFVTMIGSPADSLVLSSLTALFAKKKSTNWRTILGSMSVFDNWHVPFFVHS